MDENFVLKEGSLTSGMTDQHQIVNIIDKDVQIEDIGSFVMGDMNSSIITFKMNRYYDGTDLSNKNINVFYRTNNAIYKSEVYDVYVSNDSLKFSWIIPYDLTLVKKSKAYICISSDNYIWKTKMFDISIDASFDISTTPPSTNWFVTIESGLDSIRKELSGIYEWARQSEKPTYTYEEVGADKAGSSDNAYNKSKEYVDNISKNIKKELKTKLDKSSHTPNKWLNTDSEGNISFSDKPSYNPNEVGAAPAKHNHDNLYASKNSEHAHENKSILDGITSELIEKWSKHLTVRVEDETLFIE